jgi:hypothetical protein
LIKLEAGIKSMHKAIKITSILWYFKMSSMPHSLTLSPMNLNIQAETGAINSQRISNLEQLNCKKNEACFKIDRQACADLAGSFACIFFFLLRNTGTLPFA